MSRYILRMGRNNYRWRVFCFDDGVLSEKMSEAEDRDELMKRLLQMKKDLARKEKKYQRSLRASKAKEHVKRKLKEQRLQNNGNLQEHSSCHLENTKKQTCSNIGESAQNENTPICSMQEDDRQTTMKNICIRGNIDSDNIIQSKSSISSHSLSQSDELEINKICYQQSQNNAAVNTKLDSKSCTIIQSHDTGENLTDSHPGSSGDSLNQNCKSSDETSSLESSSKRSLSLKRRKGSNKTKRTSDSDNHQVIMETSGTRHHSMVDERELLIHKLMKGSYNDIETEINGNVPIILEQSEVTSHISMGESSEENLLDKQKYPTEGQRKKLMSKMKHKLISNSAKSNETDAALLDNCSQEYETLKLIQESHVNGVEFSTRRTRHGKTCQMPSMLSSIFQYFIDETKRMKSSSEFCLPSQHFHRLVSKKQRSVQNKPCRGKRNDTPGSNIQSPDVGSQVISNDTFDLYNTSLSHHTNTSHLSANKKIENIPDGEVKIEESDNNDDYLQSLSPTLFPSPKNFIVKPDVKDQQQRSNHVSIKEDETKHSGHVKFTENLVSMHSAVIQIGRSKREVILCLHLTSLSLWSIQCGDQFHSLMSTPLKDGFKGMMLIGKPGVCKVYEALILSQNSNYTMFTVQMLSFSPSRGHNLIECLQFSSKSAKLTWLDQRNFVLGVEDAGKIILTKYCNDMQETAKVLSFDHCEGTLKCLQTVQNLPALAAMTTEHLLHLWHTDTGTLVWTKSMMDVWPVSSSIVYSAWQQNYLFLSLFADHEQGDAGVLLVINPDKNSHKILYNYRCSQWNGYESCFSMEDYISAIDKRGYLYIWDKFSGELCSVDNATQGLCCVGQLERKFIHGRSCCIHMFSRN